MAEPGGSRTILRRYLITTAAGILAIVATLSFTQRIRAVTHRYDDVDFAFFYSWWTEFSMGGDPWQPTTTKSELRPGLERVGYCNNTPFFVAEFSPLSRLDQKSSFWVWLTLLMLCVVAAVLMLARANAPPLGAAATIIVLSLVIVSRELAGAMVGAAVTPMLLALLCASWFCGRRNQPAAAGLCLAIAALLKLYPAAAAGYFLFGRQWRALGWTVGWFVAGVVLTNPTHWIELATLDMPISYHIAGRAELTVLPFVRKVVAHLTGTTVLAAPFFTVVAVTALVDLGLLAIAAAASIAGRGRDDLDGLLFGLWVALALLMSPLAWITETLLLLPAYLFGTLAAWHGFRVQGTTGRIALIAGGTILIACIATALIKAVPHPGFPVLLAAYLSGALIFWTRLRSPN
ncbi:MAG TPA: glycosyltransferase family 87 protein [Candidatus Binatus sp.]|nr:glycosyltransferase family 87 protein [Candidatus Binatus sp.]